MAKIFVGMSGGVDSTVAAALLKDMGNDVVGLTLKLWDDASRCCNYDDIMDAKRACGKLGIRHYVLNLKKEFKKNIVDYFISGYMSGETPNPCVLCNDTIKFAALIKKMKELKFDYVATGHYARIVKKNGDYFLKAGADRTKTQEYFLARLDKDILKYIKFPLGSMLKKDVKSTAVKKGLYVEKRESQEICFLRGKETPYEFIARNRDISGMEKGSFYFTDGSKIKDISGGAYFNYTIGQRKGTGVAAGRPVYVTSLDAKNKRVIMGKKEELCRSTLELKDIKMSGSGAYGKLRCGVKIRHLQDKARAIVIISGKSALVKFDEPQLAVTPGQLAVFYNKDVVIGSGFIK
jgi:tRNA-specific 2-thiouridylase